MTLAELLVPGRTLTEADALALSAALESPSAHRDRRLDMRDQAIREAVEGLAPLEKGAAAFMLAIELRRYLATAAWAGNRDRPDLNGADPPRRLLHRIAWANCGKQVSAKTVTYVMDGHRTPFRRK